MASTFYDIEIAAIEAAAPSDGFIDPKTIEVYLAESSMQADYDLAIAKERANARYGYLIGQVQRLGNAYFSNVEAVGADAETPATKIIFRLEFEHGDASIRTADENGGAALTGAAAIKRALARALMISESAKNTDLYDPRPVREGAANARSMRVEEIAIGALTINLTVAEAAITVTKLV